MLMLSNQGFFEGMFTLSTLIFGFFSGIIFIYKSRKTNAKLLFYMGLLLFFISLIYLGVSLDFISILLTGENIDNTHGFQAIITYMWAPPTAILGIYIATELIFPRKKWYFLSTIIVLSIIYEIIIFLDPFSSLVSVPPNISGEELIHTNVIFGSPLFFIHGFFLLSIIILVNFGTLFKGLMSKGIIRKKFLLLSAGFFVYVLLTIIDAFSNPSIALIFIRSGVLGSFVLWYFGLKEETIKAKKSTPQKEMKVESSLFRVSELKPGEITEEEVTFYRDQKICLVCKGKEIGFTYICPECEAFYCVNCAQALSNLENACWVCNNPFDRSKPSKPFEKDEEDIEIQDIEDIEKK